MIHGHYLQPDFYEVPTSRSSSEHLSTAQISNEDYSGISKALNSLAGKRHFSMFPPVVLIPFAIDSLIVFLLCMSLSYSIIYAIRVTTHTNWYSDRWTYTTDATSSTTSLVILITAINIRFLCLAMTVLSFEWQGRMARYITVLEERLKGVEEVMKGEGMWRGGL